MSWKSLMKWNKCTLVSIVSNHVGKNMHRNAALSLQIHVSHLIFDWSTLSTLKFEFLSLVKFPNVGSSTKFCLNFFTQGTLEDLWGRVHKSEVQETVGSGLSTPCLKKTVQNYFCQNFVKFPPIVKILGVKMANRIRCTHYPPFLIYVTRHRTTMLNTDVPNCYITL